MSDTCNRSPLHGPETYTEASTDAAAVDKSQFEETVELNQGMVTVKVSFQRQIEVSDGGGLCLMNVVKP